MSNYYVQLSADNIVVGASQLSAPVEHPLLRQTSEYRPDLVGMRCTGEDQYEPVPPDAEPPAPEQP